MVTIPAFPPDLRRRYFLLALVLFAVIASLLVIDNASYLFGATLYENGDPGANSLSVLRAKEFHEIYGVYSRWAFHHPGPALFYAFAWSELLLHDFLHLVPTGYNAQVIAALTLNVGFLAGALSVAARWVRNAFFVPLMLLLATLHFLAIDPQAVLLGCWTPHLLPMIFFALVISAASVAAGQGDDLPLLVLAGSFAVHIHVAQPLFVLPMFVLAYSGLTWNTYRAAKAESAAGQGNLPALPWRRYARAHLFAAGLLVAFLLPLAVDLRLGRESNLAKLFEHMRTHQDQRHAWIDSFYYFIRFGSYKPSSPSEYIYPDGTSARQIWAFVASHPRTFGLWLACLLAPLAALLLRRWRRVESVAGSEAEAYSTSEQAWRWKFLSWLFAFWIISVGLTLVWGHIQDGSMFYYNSWFNYSIWLVAGVIGVASLSDVLETIFSYIPHSWVWTGSGAAVCLVATVTIFLLRADRFRASQYDDEETRAAVRTVLRSLAAHPDAPRMKYLIFPAADWPVATGIATLLTRQGVPTRVSPYWQFMFGDEYTPKQLLQDLPWKPGGDSPLDVWRVVPMKDRPELAGSPLIAGFALLDTQPEIDSAAGAQIVFGGEHPNLNSYLVDGWSPAEPGSPFQWSIQGSGTLAFRPKPIPAEDSVEVVFDCEPYPARGKRMQQRFSVAMDGDDLGTLTADLRSPGLLPWLRVPAEIWNQHAQALMMLRFPDAMSPKEAGDGNDIRPLGVGIRKISFRTATPRDNPELIISDDRPEIDASATGEISFVGEKRNSDAYVIGGWTKAEETAPFLWSTGPRGELGFRPKPIAPDAAVEVTFDCAPYTAMGKRLQQHFKVRMNGAELGTLSVDAGAPADLPHIRIPAAVWNKYAVALLMLDFPDAISPKEAGENDDVRLLALAMRKITFRVASSGEASQP